MIGRRADVGVLAGGGSSGVDSIGGVAVDGAPPGAAPEMVQFVSTLWWDASPVAAIAALRAVREGGDPPPAETSRLRRGSTASAADVAIVFAWQTRTEGGRISQTCHCQPEQDDLIRKVVAAGIRSSVVVLQTRRLGADAVSTASCARYSRPGIPEIAAG